MGVPRALLRSVSSSSAEAGRKERREVHARGPRTLPEGLEPPAALEEGQGTEILLTVEKHVVEADEGRTGLHEPRRRGLAVEALLKMVEGGDVDRVPAGPAHQQLAVERRPEGYVLESSGKALPISSPVRE